LKDSLEEKTYKCFAKKPGRYFKKKVFKIQQAKINIIVFLIFIVV